MSPQERRKQTSLIVILLISLFVGGVSLLVHQLDKEHEAYTAQGLNLAAECWHKLKGTAVFDREGNGWMFRQCMVGP